jgi:hypothetical protein
VIDETLIFAYIDGELDDVDQHRVEQAIAADPALQAMVDEHRALGAQLDHAFLPILQAPIPPAQLEGVANWSSVALLSQQRSRRAPQAVAQWFALAATLAAGILSGVMFSGGQNGPVEQRDGQLVASGPLKLALNTQLASTQSPGVPVRIGMTFKNHAGAICRSFSAQAADGVACRDGPEWQLRGLLVREKSGTGDYRMAASAGTAELVDSLIAGDALDQAKERAALGANWAPSKKP